MKTTYILNHADIINVILAEVRPSVEDQNFAAFFLDLTSKKYQQKIKQMR